MASEYVSGVFQMPEIYDRNYRFGGNGGHYDGGRRSLDGWQIFFCRRQQSFRQRGGTLPLRSGGRADDAGIFEKTYAGTGCPGFLTAEWSIRQRASARESTVWEKVRISEGEDLVGSIWDDRPALR